jgi:histidinol dehydrogenase
MKKINNPPKSEWSTILKRPSKSVEAIEATVTAIFEDVKRNGDEGVKRYSSIFDGVFLESFFVTKEEIKAAEKSISKELKEAIQVSINNITKFHEAQKTSKVLVETANGVVCWQEKRPIQKVGLYIPGGTAPLFSSVLMLAIPAKIAGCNEIVIATPTNKKGEINPAILYAAQQCGVTKILKVGGIQAIAALTFGTESIPKVYKIFGPGNQYVTTAKQLATKFGVAIDMPAGPSELLVMADETSEASFVASDLLSQAEHGVDSQVILVSTAEEKLKEVEKEIEKQIKMLPRKAIAEKAIVNSKLIYVSTKELALELINEYGPEHFIVCTKSTDFYINGIENAGSVFIGNYTPESAGDYASGTNHTLPTNGYAKAYSGVNLDAFLKTISFQEISKTGIQNIGKSIEILAEAEGLQAHKNAVTLRLNSLKNKK